MVRYCFIARIALAAVDNGASIACTLILISNRMKIIELWYANLIAKRELDLAVTQKDISDHKK